MPLDSTGHAPLRRFRPVLVLALSLSLGACASGGSSSLLSDAGPAMNSEEKAPVQTELQKATAYWGKQVVDNPQDPRATVNYAKNLKATGSKRDAMMVLQQGHTFNPNDRELNSEYGRLALEHDQVTLAQKLLEQADDPANPDWRVLSARGTVLAKQGKHAEAIAFYERAKGIAPDQPSILNNLAMAHAMAGQATKAEGLLRQAAAKPEADQRVQQNLALVLGLNGKHDEARTAGADQMAPDASAHNADVVRQLVQANEPANEPIATPVAAAPLDASKSAKGKAAKMATASVGPSKGKGKAKGAAEEPDAAEMVRRLADGSAPPAR